MFATNIKLKYLQSDSIVFSDVYLATKQLKLFTGCKKNRMPFQILSFRILRRHTRNNWFLHQALMVVRAINVPKSKFPPNIRTQINNRILTICHTLEPETTTNSAIDFNNLINQINGVVLGLQLPATEDAIEDEIPLKKIDRFIIAATNTANLLKDGNLKCYELFSGQKCDISDETIRNPSEEKMKYQNSISVNQLSITASANNIESDKNYYRTSSQLLRDLLSDTEEDLVQTSYSDVIPTTTTVEYSTCKENSSQTALADKQNLFGNDNTNNAMKRQRKQRRDFINFNNFNSYKWRKFDDDFRSDLEDHGLNYNTIVENTYLSSQPESQTTTSSGYDSLSITRSDTLNDSLSSIDLSDSESVMSQISANSSTDPEFEYDHNFDLGILVQQDTAIFDSNLETSEVINL